MSVFVGNISRNISIKELEAEFGRFGVCKITHRVNSKQGSYAFIEYASERDAEAARNEMNGRNLGGLCLNIEWSKRSGRYDPRDTGRQPAKPEKVKERCYNCGKPGHISRDCREAPECYECGGQGHIAKDCRMRDRKRSRSPRAHKASPQTTRQNSSERSVSLEKEFFDSPDLKKLLIWPLEDIQLKPVPKILPDISTGSLRANPINADEKTLKQLTNSTKQEDEESEEFKTELIADDGSQFTLVDMNDNIEQSSFRCEVCAKTMLKSSIRRHITTKTHKEKFKLQFFQNGERKMCSECYHVF